MNRASPPVVPPPAPLGPPPVPTPPPGVPPLTVAEKGAHLAGFLVGWCGLGLVVTGAGAAWALDWQPAAVAVLAVGVPPALATVVWALLPLWGEWRQRRDGHDWAQDSAYHWRTHYAEALKDAAAYRAKWYGVRPDPPAADDDLTINGRRVPRVVDVQTPAPEPAPDEDSEDADTEPLPTATEIIHQARAAVGTFLSRLAPAPPDRTTERLSELARVAPPPPTPPRGPRVPYTPAMRAIVDTYLATGKTSQRACQERGLGRAAWEAAYAALIAEGILRPGPNRTYTLAADVYHPRDPAGTHLHIARLLARPRPGV